MALDPRGSRPSSAVLSWFRMARAVQRVDQLTTEHLRDWGINIAQFDMLAQVGRAEGLTQQKLAEALLVTKGNVCQLVDRMEQTGLLRRCHHGRSNQLYLTDAGRTLFEQVVPAQERLLERLFNGLDVADQHQLSSLLRKFNHSLRHAQNKENNTNDHADRSADNHLDNR